jgi:hypothetical protein
MVPWDVCTMPKDKVRLGLINVTTQGNIISTNWVVRGLEGSAPEQVLFRHQQMTTQHSRRVPRAFCLCDIIYTTSLFQDSSSFIFLIKMKYFQGLKDGVLI